MNLATPPTTIVDIKISIAIQLDFITTLVNGKEKKHIAWGHEGERPSKNQMVGWECLLSYGKWFHRSWGIYSYPCPIKSLTYNTHFPYKCASLVRSFLQSNSKVTELGTPWVHEALGKMLNILLQLCFSIGPRIKWFTNLMMVNLGHEYP